MYLSHPSSALLRGAQHKLTTAKFVERYKSLSEHPYNNEILNKKQQKSNAKMHWTGRDRRGLESRSYVSEALSSPCAYRWNTLNSSVPAGCHWGIMLLVDSQTPW
jgi:hypothetical protein